MNESMTAAGEWLFFEAANQALNQRIAEIKALESSRSSPRLLRKSDGPSFGLSCPLFFVTLPLTADEPLTRGAAVL
jgi:hypothetical protein